MPLNEAFIQSLDKYVLNVYRLPARLDPGDTAVNKANVRLTWAELSLWSKEDTSLITCRSAERGLFYEHMSCCSVKTLKQYIEYVGEGKTWQPILVLSPGKSHGEGPDGLQSIGLQRVGHYWSDFTHTHQPVCVQ